MRTKLRNQRGPERLTDAIAYRVTASQRAFLERMADELNVNLCEAARAVIDEARQARGLMER
jgi:hypothetical protein